MMTVNRDNAARLNQASLLGASTFAGLNISAIQILPGNRLLVASDDADQGGIWLSSPYTQRSVTFTRVNANLPKGPVTDLAYIPSISTSGIPNLILAAVATQDSNAGIYVNTDVGLTAAKPMAWTLTTKNVGTPTGSTFKYNFAKAVDIHLSVWKSTVGLNTVYADTVENVAANQTLVNERPLQTAGEAITQVFRIDNLTAAPTTATWNVVQGAGGTSVPGLIDGGLNPGGQGELNSPIAADPTDRNIFYLAGDHQQANPSANVVRVNIGPGGFAQVTQVTSAGAPGSDPTVAPTLAGANAPAGAMPPGSLTAGDTYTYEYTIVDANGIESAPSPAVSITLGFQENQVTVTLPQLPQSLVANARGWRVYREIIGVFSLVGSAPIATQSIQDRLSDDQAGAMFRGPANAPTTGAFSGSAPHADARPDGILAGRQRGLARVGRRRALRAEFPQGRPEPTVLAVTRRQPRGSRDLRCRVRPTGKCRHRGQPG